MKVTFRHRRGDRPGLVAEYHQEDRYGSCSDRAAINEPFREQRATAAKDAGCHREKGCGRDIAKLWITPTLKTFTEF